MGTISTVEMVSIPMSRDDALQLMRRLPSITITEYPNGDFCVRDERTNAIGAEYWADEVTLNIGTGRRF